MRLAPFLTTILTAITLLGCAATAQGPDVWCSTNRPRTPTAAEYAGMDRASKEDMRTHNTFGAKQCGWKPSSQS